MPDLLKEPRQPHGEAGRQDRMTGHRPQRATIHKPVFVAPRTSRRDKRVAMSQIENFSTPLTSPHCLQGPRRNSPLLCRIVGAALFFAVTLTAFGQGSG